MNDSARGGTTADTHCIRIASPLELIRASLHERGVAARYLLVISQTDIGSGLGLLFGGSGSSSSQLRNACGLVSDAKACIIFGSSFQGDMEYHQLCRNISRVKLCMEAGRTVRTVYHDAYYDDCPVQKVWYVAF